MRHCEEALRRVRYGYRDRGWPLRFASVDTFPQGRDVKQARCASKGSAVPERQTPNSNRSSSNGE